MIKNVEKWFIAEVGKTNRHYFDTYFKHKFMIRHGLVSPIITGEVIDLIDAYNKHLEATDKSYGYKEPLLTQHLGITTDDNDLKKIIDARLSSEYLLKKKITDALKKSAKFTKDYKFPKVDQINQYSCLVTFEKHEIDQKRMSESQAKAKAAGLKVKKGPGDYQTVINDAMNNLYWDMRSKILDDVVNFPPPRVQIGNKRGFRGKGKKTIKGHGKTVGSGVSLSADPKAQAQTTIAVLSMAKEWKKWTASHVRNEIVFKTSTAAVDKVVDIYRGLLETQYRLSTFDKVDFDKVTGDLEIDLYVTDAKGNKALTDYDVDGIQRYIKAQREQIIKDMMGDKKYAKDAAHMEGSKSKKEKMIRLMRKAMIVNLLGHAHKMNPDLRLKVNQRLLNEAQQVVGRKAQKGKVFALTEGSRKIKSKRAKGSVRGGKKKLTPIKHRGQGRTGQSPITLRNMLNEILPQQVAKNMVAPALQFRTGRFASSARVDQVLVGPRGGTNIEYTYQRAPYETFEPGGKQGSRDRDPRRIIGQSLREVATGIIGSKFTTRSV